MPGGTLYVSNMERLDIPLIIVTGITWTCYNPNRSNIRYTLSLPTLDMLYTFHIATRRHARFPAVRNQLGFEGQQDISHTGWWSHRLIFYSFLSVSTKIHVLLYMHC